MRSAFTRRSFGLVPVLAGLVAFALLLGALLALAYAVRGPVFTSEARLSFAGSDPSQAVTGRASVALAVSGRTSVIPDVVAEQAAETLGITPRVLREHTAVIPSDTTALLAIEGNADTAEDAAAIVRALGDAYISTEIAAATAALTAQADALAAPISTLEAAVSETDPDDVLAGTQIQQLADLQGTQTRLLAAAAGYPGQIEYLTEPTVPESPSSFSPLDGMVHGIVLGLLAGGLVVFALRERIFEAPWSGDGRRVDRPRGGHHAGTRSLESEDAVLPATAAGVRHDAPQDQ